MTERDWAVILGWQSLDERQREVIEAATQDIEQRLLVERAVTESLQPFYVIGLANTWSDMMRAVFSAWWKQIEWRVIFDERDDGMLVVSLKRGSTK
jgi:hypothetical protein